MSTNPFTDLVAAAEHIREHAREIYTCDVCTTPKGRWSKDEVARHASRKTGLLAALYQAADDAMQAAHQAEIDYEAAERRIGNLVGACNEWMTLVWRRRGKGAWHNRLRGESNEDYCERMAEMAVDCSARPFENEQQARESLFQECRGACLRMREVVVHAPEKRKRILPGKRTRPMSYREAARLMGKNDSRDAAEWLSAAVESGIVHCEHVSRQTHIFHLDDFPKNVWPRILPN
jgi:hypothetical protein